MNATTTKNATERKAAELNEALSSAVDALTHFDAERLEEIEGRVSALLRSNEASPLFPAADAGRQANLDQIVANHRLLGSLLASTSLNLNVLQRLQQRNATGEVSWVR